jgi:hypothetical protein
MIISLLLSVGAIIFVSSYAVPSTIQDFVHLRVPYGVVPSEAAHILCAGVALSAYLYDKNHFYVIFQKVYLQGMLIKATLIIFTLMPDANPDCGEFSLTKCLTRNDMLPSGHMLVALSAGLVLGPYSLLPVLLCGALLVSSHMHYSVDVILSCWLVYYLERDRLAVKNGASFPTFQDLPNSLLETPG